MQGLPDKEAAAATQAFSWENHKKRLTFDGGPGVGKSVEELRERRKAELTQGSRFIS